MQCHLFHLMPYPHLPPDFDDMKKYPTSWVIFSNKHYDPVKGVEIYNRYLDELEWAEELGFDGVCVNEHHQNAYGTMPAPNIMAAALTRRTKRVKILVLGNGLPLRDHPLRVAEEIAMLDVMSGGRIVSGFVRGVGVEYFSMGVNPTYSRERFAEAHDLIIKSWTEPGPFDFEGKHYRVRYVNVWPRPLQKPHPPIWIPSFGSRDTGVWCAHPSRKYAFLSTYLPDKTVKGLFDACFETARQHNYELSPYQLGRLMPIYVAETDEQARREGNQHIAWLFHRGLRYIPEMLFPPGYLSPSAALFMAKSYHEVDWTKLSVDEMSEAGYCVVGSVETVKRRLANSMKEMGWGILMPLLQIGDMPADRTRKNMKLFATEVMPYLRAEFDNLHPMMAKSA